MSKIIILDIIFLIMVFFQIASEIASKYVKEIKIFPINIFYIFIGYLIFRVCLEIYFIRAERIKAVTDLIKDMK